MTSLIGGEIQVFFDNIVEPLLIQLTSWITSTSVLVRMAQDEEPLPVEIFNYAAEQRYFHSAPIEDLFRVCIELGKEFGCTPLVEAMELNLQDEMGLNADGTAHADGSHEQWRADYLDGIGVVPTIARGAALSTKLLLEQIISGRNIWEICGAICFIEYSIPREYTAWQRMRNMCFPSLPAAARRFLDDHIVHDAMHHYPGIKAGTIVLMQEQGFSDEKLTSLISGIMRAATARRLFYERLEAEQLP